MTAAVVDDAFLDAVVADATGQHDASKFLSNDPHAWRTGITAALDRIRGELAGVNADIKVNHPRSYHRHELEQRRAALCEEQAALEIRLRFVKPLCEAVKPPPTPPSPKLATPTVEPTTPIEAARAHLYAALDILRDLAAGS